MEEAYKSGSQQGIQHPGDDACTFGVPVSHHAMGLARSCASVRKEETVLALYEVLPNLLEHCLLGDLDRRRGRTVLFARDTDGLSVTIALTS